jgi:DNA recombination protein RmuC
MGTSAREVSRLGQELHERLRTLAGHFEGLRQGLDRAVEAYNGTVGSLESRVLPAARRFKELGAAAGEEIPPLRMLEKTLRRLTPLDDQPERPPH